jgi:hypothetical protein
MSASPGRALIEWNRKTGPHHKTRTRAAPVHAEFGGGGQDRANKAVLQP